MDHSSVFHDSGVDGAVVLALLATVPAILALFLLLLLTVAVPARWRRLPPTLGAAKRLLAVALLFVAELGALGTVYRLTIHAAVWAQWLAVGAWLAVVMALGDTWCRLLRVAPVPPGRRLARSLEMPGLLLLATALVGTAMVLILCLR